MSATTTTTTGVEKTVTENANNLSNNNSNNVTRESADLSSTLVTKVASIPQMVPDWTNRRRLIFYSAYFSAGCFAFISTTVCVGLLLGFFRVSKSPVDPALANITETIIYSITFFVSTVMGTYCFGSAWESGAYRKNIANVATTTATSGNPTQ